MGMADRIAICQAILKINNDRVLFVHQSAPEYLLRKHPDEDLIAEGFRMEASKCHGEIAHRCLQILENSFSQHITVVVGNVVGGFKQPVIIKRDQLPAEPRTVSELFNYADLYWMKHARLSPRDAEYLFDVSRPFFKKSSEIRKDWANSKNRPPRRLHVASYFGIVPWLQAHREEGRTISFHGTRR